MIKLKDILNELEVNNPNKTHADIMIMFDKLTDYNMDGTNELFKVWKIINKYDPNIESVPADLKLLSQFQLNSLYKDLQQLKDKL